MPPAECRSLAALHVLEETPDITQRRVTRERGVSLGHTNYCVQALVPTVLVKVGHFCRGYKAEALAESGQFGDHATVTA